MNRFFGRFSIATKLRLISLTFLVPIVALLLIARFNITGYVEFAHREQQGLVLMRPLSVLLCRLPESYLASDARAAVEVESAWSELLSSADRQAGVLGLTPEALSRRHEEALLPEALQKRWQSLRNTARDEASLKSFYSLLADLRGLYGLLGDSSGLILDPDLDTFYLMDALVSAWPRSMQRLAEVERFVEPRLGSSLSPEDARTLAVHLAFIGDSDLSQLRDSFANALSHDAELHGVEPSLQGAVSTLNTEYQHLVAGYLEQANRILKSDTSVRADAHQSALRALRDKALQFSRAGLDSLDAMLEVRESTYADRRSAQTLLTVLVVSLALTLVWLVTRSIVVPLTGAVGLLERVAGGDFTELSFEASKDETGRINLAIRGMVERLGETLRGVAGNAHTLSEASQRLDDTSDSVRKSASLTSKEVGTVASSAEQISRNITSVATATEEMRVTAEEIARNTAEAAKVATAASNAASHAKEQMDRLGGSSQRIGDISRIITAIAEQTNLLALNATIEAARAGAAGKGFAVVAGEIKQLSLQTAKATEEIRVMIREIQADSGGAAESIREIAQVVERINRIQGVIASSVEEQSASTAEISRSLHEVSDGSAAIAKSIAGVADAAGKTNEGSRHTSEAAMQLSTLAVELEGAVSRFRL